MEIFEYGSPDAQIVLIQPVDDHDLSGIENEISAIGRLTDRDFRLAAVKIDSWNTDLSPWKAPAVFGSEDFGGGAERTLKEILTLTADTSRTYIIGGYSLAGLFALWAVYQTDVFSGAAAASPSVWFPGFMEYLSAYPVRSRSVYLSLGDRESRTKNPVMATVGEKIRDIHALLQSQGISSVLEWNPGNHFQSPDLRTAKAFAWSLNRIGH